MTNTLISKWDTNAIREYAVGYDHTNDRFDLQVFNSSGGSVGIVRANNFGAPSVNTWYFIVAWYNSVANTLNIQVNNGTADSSAGTGAPSATTAGFRIGTRASTPTNFFDGRIDAVGFWKKVLSTAEKQDLYNAGSGEEYPFTVVDPSVTRDITKTYNGDAASQKLLRDKTWQGFLPSRLLQVTRIYTT